MSFLCPGPGDSKHAVFVGKVIDVRRNVPTHPSAILSSVKVRLRVQESFGGLADKVAEIDVLTGSGGGDCGVPFAAGETYLVGAVLYEGLLRVSACGYTRPLTEVGATLRLLRERRNGKRLPSISGTVERGDTPQARLRGRGQPVPNIQVRLVSRGKSYEAVTDSAGIFAFYGLPEGAYEFAPELPQGTKPAWHIAREFRVPAFDYKAGSCQERNLLAIPSESLRNRPPSH